MGKELSLWTGTLSFYGVEDFVHPVEVLFCFAKLGWEELWELEGSPFGNDNKLSLH